MTATTFARLTASAFSRGSLQTEFSTTANGELQNWRRKFKNSSRKNFNLKTKSNLTSSKSIFWCLISWFKRAKWHRRLFRYREYFPSDPLAMVWWSARSMLQQFRQMQQTRVPESAWYLWWWYAKVFNLLNNTVCVNNSFWSSPAHFSLRKKLKIRVSFY